MAILQTQKGTTHPLASHGRMWLPLHACREHRRCVALKEQTFSAVSFSISRFALSFAGGLFNLRFGMEASVAFQVRSLIEAVLNNPMSEDEVMVQQRNLLRSALQRPCKHLA